MIDTRKEMGKYVKTGKYARHIASEQRRETWSEATKRMMNMHRAKYGDMLTAEEYDEIETAIINDEILPSMRAMQFGGMDLLPRSQDMKLYNCSFSYCDRPRFFAEAMMNLLCGSGVGFSVQRHHSAKLPKLVRGSGTMRFVVSDTIEGWADAIDMCVNQYFEGGHGKRVIFDFSQIRPKGAPLSTGVGLAPGPERLQRAIMQINSVFVRCLSRGMDRLRPIDAYDITMYLADAVRSGGVRRSATICLFSVDDEEMMNAKTGEWYTQNPQRARSNNSAIIVRSEAQKQDFNRIINATKERGDPGFYMVDSLKHGTNPCAEVGFYPVFNGVSGWQFCNLSTINMATVDSQKEYNRRARLASRIATLQAGHTNFAYLGSVSEEITKREALIGVSMTAMAQCPKFAYNEDAMSEAAQEVVKENKRVAKMIGINQAARTTCLKPEGSGTLAIGQMSSGIHPAPARQGIRRITAGDDEPVALHFASVNPDAVERSSYDPNEVFLCFPFTLGEDTIVKRDVSAIEQLELVKMVKRAWVDTGKNEHLCTDPTLSNNVSNTINVADHEWDAVSDFIFKNRESFAGVAMLGHSGDIDYDHAPEQSVWTIDEILAEYGEQLAGEAVEHMKDGFHPARDPSSRTALDECMLRLRDLAFFEEISESFKPVDYTELKEADASKIKLAESVACAGGVCNLV